MSRKQEKNTALCDSIRKNKGRSTYFLPLLERKNNEFPQRN